MAPNKNKVKLTNAIIPKLESSYTWDTIVSQFGCRFFSKSGKRTFIYRYRGMNNKQREFRIGIFPAVDVNAARLEAQRLHLMVMNGKDPQHIRTLNIHKTRTFAQTVDAYLGKASTSHKKTSLREVTSYCKLHIKPLFGEMLICDLTKGVVQRRYDKLQKKMSISYLNKMIAWARTIWNWGRKREMVEGENPFVIDIKSVKKRRKRIVRPREFVKLWEVIERYRAQGLISQTTLNAIEMTLLTPLRKSEVFRLKWSHIDHQNGFIRVTDHKLDHVDDDIELFITEPLGELINRLPPTRSMWMFPSPRSESGHIEDIDTAWKSIRNEAGIPDVTIHDLRRTWNSTGATLGYTPHQMASVIGNSPQVNEDHYWFLFEDERRKISEEVANKLVSFKQASAH